MMRIFLFFVIGFSIFWNNLSTAEERQRERWRDDTRLLPQYCKDLAKGKFSPEWNRWRATLGGVQIHMAHYCSGVDSEQKAKITADKDKRKKWLQNVKHQMRYVSNNCPASCVLYPELHTRWGWALGEDGQTSEAIEHFQLAIGVKPDYTSAYAKLSDLYLKINKPDEARRVLDEGLKAKPGSRMLQRRLRELETQ